MLRIGGAPEYTWRNLDRFDGAVPEDGTAHVAFEMREADGVDEGLAENHARAAITEILNGEQTANEYGIDSDKLMRGIEAGNKSIFIGVGFTIYAVELAMICGRSMRGVEDVRTGQAAIWDRGTVMSVLRSRRPGADPFQGMGRMGSTYADTFFAIAMKTVKAARLEGKSSAVAPNGNGATA